MRVRVCLSVCLCVRVSGCLCVHVCLYYFSQQEYVLLFPREDLAVNAAKRLKSARRSAHTDPTFEPFLRRLVVERPVVTTFEVGGGGSHGDVDGAGSEARLDTSRGQSERHTITSSSSSSSNTTTTSTTSTRDASETQSHELENVLVARIPPGMDERRLQRLFQQELGVEDIHGLERADSASSAHDLVRARNGCPRCDCALTSRCLALRFGFTVCMFWCCATTTCITAKLRPGFFHGA